jgi:nitric oxide reductase activation protein
LISDLARIQIAADALEAILRQASSATNATPEGIIRLLAERDARATSKSNEVVEIPNLTLKECDHARIRHERAATLPQEAVEWTRARDSLQPQIAALRNKMCFHSRPRRLLLGGQAEGRLDARRIWKAPFDTEIFGRYEDRKSNRFDDCTCAILLDSSSSMYDYGRYQQAFRMAVLLVEGLDRLIRIRVFSHFYDDVNVVVLEHQQPRRSMHCYQPRESNVDSQAILLVGSLLRNVPGHRVLISLSDGLPCSYRGLNAIAETRQAVETVRSTGVRVLGVNIGHAWNASIYAPFALHIPDAEKLPQEIEKLVIGELRKLID